MSDDLAQQVGRLSGLVEEGFKGVHHRLDMLNGRVEHHELRLGTAEQFDAKLKGSYQMQTRLITILGGGGVIGWVVIVVNLFLGKP